MGSVGATPAAEKSAQKKAFPAPGIPTLEREHSYSRRKAESRRRILAAARKLFVEKGYHHVRTQDIASAAGIGQGSFYFHFEDKLECFIAFTNDAASELESFIRPYMEFGSRIEGVRFLVQGAFDYSLSNPGVLRTIVADISVLSIGKKCPYLYLFPSVPGTIDDLKRSGIIADDIDSKLLIYLIGGAIRQGDILVSHSPEKKDEILQNILSFFARGLSGAPLSSFVEEPIPASVDVVPPMDIGIASEIAAHDAALNFSEKKLANRRRILEAARKLFTEQGYDATSPIEIAKQAGLGIGTFYTYFKDKLDCFLSFIDEANFELADSARQCLESVTTFPEVVNAMLRNQFEYSRENPGVFRALVADIKVLSRKGKITNKGRSEWTCQYIDNLKQLGKIDTRFDTRLLAYLIGGVLAQANAYIADYPDKREETIESVSCFIINAIRSRNR